MVQHHQGYYNQLSAALVRGALGTSNKRPELFTKKLEDLTPDEISELIQQGLEKNVNLHLLRRGIEDPHVTRIMAVLRGVQPDNLLDIGMEYGAFMWRLLDEFKFLPVFSLDISSNYHKDVSSVQKGGFINLKGKSGSLADLNTFHNEQFDVVTGLDVLKTPADFEKPFSEICRIAKRFVIITVETATAATQDKSKMIKEADIRAAYQKKDIYQVKIDNVPGRMIAVGRK